MSHKVCYRNQPTHQWGITDEDWHYDEKGQRMSEGAGMNEREWQIIQLRWEIDPERTLRVHGRQLFEECKRLRKRAAERSEEGGDG